MNLGFYYHAESEFRDGICYVPSHLGRFLEALAEVLGSVTYYGHGDRVLGIEDYALRPPTIRAVDLGPRRSFPARTFFPCPALARFRPAEHKLDAMVIRGPTPLLPHLVKRCREIPVVLYLVGSYSNWQPRSSEPRWRNTAIGLWVRLYELQQRRATRNALVLANNEELVHSVTDAGAQLVFTSSLTQAEADASSPAPWEPGLGVERPIRLLYSGRIVREKGLFETISAVRLLRDKGIRSSFQLVGWEDPADPTIEDLLSHARELDVVDAVSYLGYKPAGPDLLDVYHGADVFVIPTYWEGFPRAIIDAMGMGLPVIASRVGSIPRRLTDRRNALLIEPRSPEAVAGSVQELITDRSLWERVAEGGWQYAREHTLERSAQLLASHVRSWSSTTRSLTGS